MMEKIKVTNQKLFEASRAENQKLRVDVREASRAEETNKMLLTEVQEASRAECQKLLADVRKRLKLKVRKYKK